jgi:AraC-like DNA-binding protein
MKRLTIEQEGIGKLQLLHEIPKDLNPFVLETALPVSLLGEGFKALFQKLSGKGFVVWFSRYWMHSSTVLRATDHEPALELRISLRNEIKGTWDKITAPQLPAYHYQISFVPFVVTRATFEAVTEYETFDIHFELSFLEQIGLDYKQFQLFINQVLNDQPAELSPAPRRCPPLMTEAIHSVLYNNYSTVGKARLLQTSVENILLAALEDADRIEMILPELTTQQREALQEVKRLIEESFPKYPGNRQLCKKTCLNLFLLNFGFKRLFVVNPYKYYTLLRMEKGKELLCKGESVNSVAAELEFESPRAFGKAFKTMFGMTPKEYRAGFRK